MEPIYRCVTTFCHPGLLFSLVVAAVLVTLRTALIRETLAFSLLNLLASGVIIPLLILNYDSGAELLVYGLVSGMASIFLGSLIRKFLKQG